MNHMKMKKLFSYIKSLRADFCGVDTLQKDDVLYSDNETKANLLNQYFASKIMVLIHHP